MIRVASSGAANRRPVKRDAAGVLPIASVRIGDRHRKDMGDVDALAASIKLVGLLQPIGVSPTGELVFGERRLHACKALKWKEIPARTIKIESIVAGEYHENEIRKDFTTSERVAIERSINAEMERRKGKRDLPQNLVGSKNRVAEESARKAGFGNRTTASQARKVVDRGAPELIAAMDAGRVSISDAAKIAELPRKEQRERVVLPLPREAKKKAAETGNAVLARDGRYYSDAKPDAAGTDAWFALKEAVEAINKLPPANSIALTIIPHYQRAAFIRQVTQATDWLDTFAERLEQGASNAVAAE